MPAHHCAFYYTKRNKVAFRQTAEIKFSHRFSTSFRTVRHAAPQNGDRIVTIDCLTSLHPMYSTRLVTRAVLGVGRREQTAGRRAAEVVSQRSGELLYAVL